MSQARVHVSTFAARKGAVIKCEVDGVPIAKGEKYRWFKVGFRARFKHIRCMRQDHYPKPSTLESSMLSEAYSSVEDAEANLATLAAGEPEDDATSIEEAVRAAADGIRSVSEQYGESAEAMGSAGEELQEKSDLLGEIADTIEYWDPEESEPDFDNCDNTDHDVGPGDEGYDPEKTITRGDTAACESCAEIKQEWWNAQIGAGQDALSSIEWP